MPCRIRLYSKMILMKHLMIIVALAGLYFVGCDKEAFESSCYSFDIRQCQTDGFASEVPESDPVNQREKKMEAWLEDAGYKVEEIKLLVNFHAAVCEACDVCPQGDRYFIRVKDSDDNPDAEELRLLNFEATPCGDAF